MHRVVLALALVACGGARPAEVTLALPAPTVAAGARATLLGCTIVGTGERRRDDGEEPFAFQVFDTREANEPVFVIARPEMAHVTWSQFPERAGRGRARVGLGGQAHVHFEGYADLYGRTFTVTTRMDSVDGHLWAFAGSPIDMMSASRTGEVFGSVQTPFRAPRTIVVHGNCANVIYEPTVPRREAKPRNITAVSDAPSFRLFAEPGSARPFTTITPSSPAPLEVVERRGDFVRVTGEEANIGFDAWVNAADIREIEGGHGRIGSAHYTRRPIMREDGLKRGYVSRDAPLYVSGDDAPYEVKGAIVEQRAVVDYNPLEATVVDGRQMVPFAFDDHFIVAREGGRLWIAKDVVSSTP